jgi:hypothetical protein
MLLDARGLHSKSLLQSGMEQIKAIQMEMRESDGVYGLLDFSRLWKGEGGREGEEDTEVEVKEEIGVKVEVEG